MKKRLLGLRNSTYIAIAVALTLVGLVPLMNARALAYTQLTTRSIKMSSSAAGNTGTKYTVTYTATTGAKNVRLDFCSNSPLYTDSCSPPTGMDASAAALTAGGPAPSGWAIVSGGSTTGANFVTISATSAYTAPGTITFELTNIKNPTTTGTFYGRIYTYANQTNDYTAAATPGTVADFGGIAMSTANLISITAKVQETLTFCVSGSLEATASDAPCASVSPPTITIGHGTPATIDANTIDAASAYTQVSTNASGGISMRMKSGNTCSNGGLSSNGGSTCNIPGITAAGNTSGTTPQGITAGVAMFGLFVAPSTTNTGTAGSGGIGTITAASPYVGALSHNTASSPTTLYYGMEQGTTGVTSDYGSTIATSPGPLSLVNNQLVFGATAALTTQAGIYTVNESIIVTGTF
jgi:hypothetical protein